MNAANATWDLCLNKAYGDGGYENSSRVFGLAGWDYALPVGRVGTLRSGTAVFGALNDPSTPAFGWSVEVALPLATLAQNTSATFPPAAGDVWRINFSRVEYAVDVINGQYKKASSCQSCPTPGAPNEDNWVWSPQGAIAMHLPEKWGILQFARGPVNATPAMFYKEWPVRAIAAEIYYAQHAYAAANNGAFTSETAALGPFVSHPFVLDGTCTAGLPLVIHVGLDAKGNPRFNVTVPPVPAGDAVLSATIQDDRLLTLSSKRLS